MKMADSLMGNGCGLDDDELRHVAEQLESVDCGMSSEELRRAVEQYEALPEDKREQIAAVLTDRKLYEEDLCNRYGISRPTVYRWMEKGKLPKYRHDGGGKNYLYCLEADKTVREYEKRLDQ